MIYTQPADFGVVHRLCVVLLFAVIFVLQSLPGARADAAPVSLSFTDEQVNGPASPADFATWLAAMKVWRTQQMAAINYDGSYYALPALSWERNSFIQPLMMVEDRYFYDPVAQKYTVGKYLADVKSRYGGIDSILIWPTYPNMGIDDRNTDDMMRCMPGGIAGVKKMAAAFHKAGVRVIFPIHPWDVGTRDPGASWAEVLPKSMVEIGADGLNGDTMDAVSKDFMDSALAQGHPLALEPELGLRGGETDQLPWNTMHWGYWQTELFPPLAGKYKWLEPRLMVHVCDRWDTNKTGLIQSAFFNGAGIATWENVFGIWNGLTERDAEAVRRVATVERAFPDLLTSPQWEPFTPVVQSAAVFASKWPDPGDGRVLWTLVNRSGAELTGDQLRTEYKPGAKFYDVWHGVELQPRIDSGATVLQFPIEAHGYGAVLETNAATEPDGLSRLLSRMRTLTRTPLSSYSAASAILPQTLTPIRPTTPVADAPAGMVKIPAGSFDFKVGGVELEDNGPGVDIQYPWERVAVRNHEHTMTLAAFYMDRFPVTNEAFKEFLQAARYHPRDDFNFLKDWRDGTYQAGWANRPVTWVSLEDARAYAAWAHKRLPHEWEWQYAAQGSDGRLYPWGTIWDDSKAPQPDKGRQLTMPAPVDAFDGTSPFGVRDLAGNVWQWTDEYTDAHTRAAVLRGGSYYQPQGSGWYFPQAYRLDQHGKYLLMSPGRDRSGTVGFRCAVDAQ